MRPNSQDETLFEDLATFGARVVTPRDDEYPHGLRDLCDPPLRLYVRGTLPQGGIAIVGTRTPPQAAIEFAYELARRVRDPVISGLARGVDTAAHRGAFTARRPTVAYVGHGFGATYPPENANVEMRIAAGCGAVATERPPYARVAPWALVKRDRLQAAHAWATVIVASDAEGGAMHTWRYAVELGRATFALTPPDDNACWGGNAHALARGAFPLPNDVDEALRQIESKRKEL